MKKLVITMGLTLIVSSATANESLAYQTKEQVFEEWLILNTCVEHSNKVTTTDKQVDSDKLLLDCVNEAKKNQVAIKKIKAGNLN